MDPHTWNQLGLGLTQGEQRREEDECCDDLKKFASAHIYFKDKQKREKRNDDGSESYHSETNNDSEGEIMVKVRVMLKSFLTLLF